MTAEDYVNRVAFELHDLPWGMRRQLLSELRDHLDELPAGTDLSARLGPPERYAADLRSAACLERRRGPIAFLQARRPRNLVLIVVVITLIGLAIGAVVWVDSYQPLVAAGSMANPAGAREDSVGGVESVVFRQGRPFRFGIDILNAGSRTVRVLGVSYGPGRCPFRRGCLCPDRPAAAPSCLSRGSIRSTCLPDRSACSSSKAFTTIAVLRG